MAHSSFFAFLHLFDDASAGIADAPIEEEWVCTVLHFHDDMVAGVGRAIDVVDHAALVVGVSQLFLVVVEYIGDAPFAFEQVVEKINEQWLAELLPENAFESPVSEGVDEFSHNLQCFVGDAAKVRKRNELCQLCGGKGVDACRMMGKRTLRNKGMPPCGGMPLDVFCGE